LIENNIVLNSYRHAILQELMYQDPAKNAMAFQSYVQLTMLEMHQANFDHPVKVMERSIHSARSVT
jgi:Deoxynucleoside kinase